MTMHGKSHGNEEPRPLTATVDIDAPPPRVWSVVSDIRRTGEWSPECRKVIPIGGVRRDSMFIGLNRRGPIGWATLSKITSYIPDVEIGWQVTTNWSEWTYKLKAIDGGTRLTQTRRTPRGEAKIGVLFARYLLGGIEGHDDELEEGMLAGLQKIKDIAETPTHSTRPAGRSVS